MSVSQISICNSALVKVGAERISSIDESKKSAIILKAVWNEARDSVLRAHPWNFAIRRDQLAPNGTTPAWGYTYQFDIPNDVLRVLDTDPDDIDFVVEGRKILANENLLNVKFIFRQEDESEWDACFAEAMAWKLAESIAYNLTQSSTLAKACDDKYKAVLAEARSMDGAEGIIQGFESDEWTNARRR